MKKQKLLNSFKNAIQGILNTIKKERNIKIHFMVMILVIISGFYFKINIYEWIICIILFGIVISAELFNTTIEKIVDIIIPYKDEKAKFIKDVAAGAVLINAIVAAIIGLIIFIPKIINIL